MRVKKAERFEVGSLTEPCNAILREIDRWAKGAGLAEDDDTAGELRGLAVSLRIRLRRWAESL